jgi:SAM-dependent methyltransferase
LSRRAVSFINSLSRDLPMFSARSGTQASPFELLGNFSDWVWSWNAPERACVREVLELAELESNTRLLDVGCGSGHLLAAAAHREPSAVLVGVEPDRDSVELARKRLQAAPSRVVIHATGGESLPFADECFDVVTCTLVLRTLTPAVRSAVLAECRRVLRPEGRLIAVEWQPRACSLARIADPLLGALRAFGWTWTQPTLWRADLVEELERRGFDGAETISPGRVKRPPSSRPRDRRAAPSRVGHGGLAAADSGPAEDNSANVKAHCRSSRTHSASATRRGGFHTPSVSTL